MKSVHVSACNRAIFRQDYYKVSKGVLNITRLLDTPVR